MEVIGRFGKLFLQIPEFGGMVLRVAVNNKVVPELVVSECIL